MAFRPCSIAWSCRVVLAFALVSVLLLADTAHTKAKSNVTPDPLVDDSLSAVSGQRMAVLAGGCFWGMQLVFEHVKGVSYVMAGYSGGSVGNPSYEMVSSGQTGHAESVKILYDPSKVTYGTLLKVFFSVAHDPTQLNRQGPDEGSQYRSIIFFNDEDQERIAKSYIAQLTEASVFSHKIVTQLVPFQPFYPAEAYHQDYAIHNRFNPYIAEFDLPKLDDLRKSLPSLYVKQ